MLLLRFYRTTMNFYRDVAVLAFPTLQNDHYRLESWKEKSLRELRVRAEGFYASYEEAPQDAVIAATDIQNITHKMDVNGVLTLDAPDDDWTVLRLGYTTTAAFIRPGSKGGQGLEIDKMSRAAADIHWNHLIEKTAYPL